MISKKHNSQGRLVLAICDDALLNKKFQEEGKILDLGSSFFKGEKMPVEMLISLIEKAYIINAVGEKTIDLLIRNHKVTKEEVLFVGKIPYVQILFEAKR